MRQDAETSGDQESLKSKIKIGTEGFAFSSLRPKGTVIIDESLYEAESLDQTIILKKTPIVVVEVKEKTIIVKTRDY